MASNIAKPIIYGILAGIALFGLYFTVVSMVSGWNYALDQFYSFWYFVVSLTAGFGIQVGLYQYIKNLVHSGRGMGKVVGVSGATSTAAMISCCAHYLVNLVPVLGVTGLVAFVAQYQVELFWFGLASNIFGITYMANRLTKLKKSYG